MIEGLWKKEWKKEKIDEMKRCPKCGKMKPMDAFSPPISPRMTGWCKKCVADACTEKRKGEQGLWKEEEPCDKN